MSRKVLFVSHILHGQDGQKLLCPLDESMSACGEHCAWFNMVENTNWKEEGEEILKGTKFFCKDYLIGTQEKEND